MGTLVADVLPSSPDQPSGSESEFDAILEAARDGDGVAFARLYERHNRSVHGFVRLQKATDPEGTVNEVFLRAYRSLPTFVGSEARFRGWLLAIARNRLIDEARRRAVRPPEVPLEGHEVSGATTDEPEAEVLRLDAESELVDHLAALTKDQRDVVLLRVVGGQSLAATAEIIGKEVGAVKALQLRALRRLEATMQAEVGRHD